MCVCACVCVWVCVCVCVVVVVCLRRTQKSHFAARLRGVSVALFYMVNTIAKKVDDGEGVVHNHPLKELNFTQENRHGPPIFPTLTQQMSSLFPRGFGVKETLTRSSFFLS